MTKASAPGVSTEALKLHPRFRNPSSRISINPCMKCTSDWSVASLELCSHSVSHGCVSLYLRKVRKSWQTSSIIRYLACHDDGGPVNFTAFFKDLTASTML